MRTSSRATARLNAYPEPSLEQFRRTLLRMRDLACAEMGGLVEKIPEGSLRLFGAGGASQAAGRRPHAAQFDLAEAEQERLLAYMDSLDSALQRLAEGRYGRCVDCGSPIGTERLEGLPCAERCRMCQLKRIGR